MFMCELSGLSMVGGHWSFSGPSRVGGGRYWKEWALESDRSGVKGEEPYSMLSRMC